MSKNNEITEKKLRQRFASNKPQLVARGEYATVQGEPLAKAYFNGEVLKYEGKVISPVKETENVKSPTRIAMYAVEKGGFSKIAEGANEAVAVDQKKINRMNLHPSATKQHVYNA